MRDVKDIRFKILGYLQRNGHSTEEVHCNDFLFTTHNDLATIKRTLKELIEKGYINESNVNWDTEKETRSVIYNIKTDGATGQLNNRIERLKDRNEISEIRLYLTLDGKRFLIESDNLRRTTWTIKYDFLIKFSFLVIGAGLTLGGNYVYKHYLDTRTDQNKEPSTITVPSEKTDSISNKIQVKEHTDTIK